MSAVVTADLSQIHGWDISSFDGHTVGGAFPGFVHKLSRYSGYIADKRLEIGVKK